MGSLTPNNLTSERFELDRPIYSAWPGGRIPYSSTINKSLSLMLRHATSLCQVEDTLWVLILHAFAIHKTVNVSVPDKYVRPSFDRLENEGRRNPVKDAACDQPQVLSTRSDVWCIFRYKLRPCVQERFVIHIAIEMGMVQSRPDNLSSSPAWIMSERISRRTQRPI